MRNNLNQMREDSGKGVLELCALANISMPTFYRLEQVRKGSELETFTIGTLAAVCKALKVRPSEIFPEYF